MHHQTNDGAEADAEGASPRGRAVAFFPVPPVLSTPDYVVAFESVGAPDSGGEGCRGGAGDGDGCRAGLWQARAGSGRTVASKSGGKQKRL